ncbi:MAG: zinc-binding dehydrogenase [Candidatus Dormibacteria bacterium]
MMHSDAGQLRELVALAEGGRLTTRVAATFGFDEAALAHTSFASGGVRGRLVLVP